MAITRRLLTIMVLASFLATGLPELVIGSVAISYAQEKPKGLLELLFGGGLKKRSAKPEPQANTRANRVKISKPSEKRTPKKSRKTSSSARAATDSSSAVAADDVVVAEKSENASKILVIGDFMAGQLANGLKDVFAGNPGIVIEDASVALSGIVRNDVKNWPLEVVGHIDEFKPITVIALIGMNDRQLLNLPGGRLNKLTDQWNTEYNKRLDELAKAVRQKNIAMIWVGLPPVSSGNMSADYLKFNERYRAAVEQYGGAFVDVWDGFTDDEGKYVSSGPDVNGQIVGLRRADGINMTSSGEIKLAFFAEKSIKRLTGFGKDALITSLGPIADLNSGNEPQYDPAGTGRTIVIALGSPNADGGSSLEGETGFLTATDAKLSTSYELVIKGIVSQPHEGRVDAPWGKPSFDIASNETPEPVLANMRGFSMKSFLDALPPLPDEGVDAAVKTDTGKENPAPVN